MIVEPDKSHDLSSVCWSIREDSGISQSRSKGLRIIKESGSYQS